MFKTSGAVPRWATREQQGREEEEARNNSNGLVCHVNSPKG